jgi:hypothetical protein
MKHNEIVSKNWETFKTRLKSRWNLPDSEIDRYQSNLNLLCQKIQTHYQESRIIVQDFVDNLWFEVFVRSSRKSLPEDSPVFERPDNRLAA